jgi:hypothetical protein
MSQHHDHTHPADNYYLPQAIWERGRNVITALMILAWVACGVGYASDHKQFFASYLVAFFFCISIAAAAALFTMIQHLTGATWSVPVRRMMENIMMSLPLGAVLFIPIALGVHELYEWSHADVIAKDKVLQGKAAFLNPEAFYIRAAIYFLIWSLWAWRLYSLSRNQDTTRDIQKTFSADRFSAPGILLFFLSFSLASFDWVMSLNPHWYSTIFGIYCYAGGAFGMFGLLTWMLIQFRHHGVLQHTVTIEHYHDLGKWQFAMTVFWAYIAFSQYMLIWYANLPEETIFYKMRIAGSWSSVSATLILGHFVFMFIMLLSRASKRNLTRLVWMSAFAMLMHYVDVYWLVMPNFFTTGVALHWLDLATFVAVFSTFAFGFWMRFRSTAIAPIGDPRFEKSLEFQNV